MKKTIMVAIAFCLMMGSASAGEWWVDPILEEHGDGTELNPFMSMAPIDTAITPGAEHTIHLIGRPGHKYQGGFGGYNLRRWIYGNCTIVEHGPVQFSPTRSVPFSEFSDGPVAGTKVLYIHPKFPMRKYRFYADIDNQQMVLTRAIYLGKDQMKGFAWDREKHKLTVTPAIVVGKTAHTTRRAKLKQMRADYIASLNAIASVASNPELLDQIEVPK